MIWLKKASFYIVTLFFVLASVMVLYYLNLVLLQRPYSDYFYISLVATILSGALVLLFFFLRVRSFTVYHKYIKRLSLGEMENFIAFPTFPERDELGDLGKYLNRFMGMLKIFDNLKKDKLSLEKRKIAYLLDTIPQPVIIINAKGEILRANKTFNKEFKYDSDKVFDTLKLTSVLEGDEASTLFSDFSILDKQSEKNEINTVVNGTSYLLSFSIHKEVSFSGDIAEFIIIISKRHRSIFSKT